MSKPFYIAMDVETGGIGHDKSLLSVYMLTLDADFNPLDSIDLLVKPDNGIYTVTAEALGINKINLVEHDKKAVTYTAAGTAIYEFLNRNNPQGGEKLVMFGHNVAFDAEFIKATLINPGTWNKYIAYSGALEIGGTVRYFKAKGVIPQDLKGGLGSIAKYFGIDNSEAHTAKGDVMMYVAIMKKLLTL